MDIRIEMLKNFMDASHSVYHAAADLEKVLTDAGYTRMLR